MDKLLPCPFCGGAPILELFNDGFFDYARIRCCRVMFDWCGDETGEQAIAAWNRRAGKDINVATNADRIRGATDEKLANVISAALGKMSYGCYRCPAEEFCHSGECEQAWLDWLKQPVKEEWHEDD